MSSLRSRSSASDDWLLSEPRSSKSGAAVQGSFKFGRRVRGPGRRSLVRHWLGGTSARERSPDGSGLGVRSPTGAVSVRVLFACRLGAGALALRVRVRDAISTVRERAPGPERISRTRHELCVQRVRRPKKIRQTLLIDRKNATRHVRAIPLTGHPPDGASNVEGRTVGAFFSNLD